MLPSRAPRVTRLFVALFCLFPSTLLLAQSTGGRILGRVADPSGAVLKDVKVTLVNESTAVSRSVSTNESGDYVFVEVAPGNYYTEYELTGFKKNIRHGITVDVNQVVTLNMVLQVGAAQEVVDVTSEAPLVDTTSTQLGAVVNNRSVNELPLNARDTYQFLQLQPGVQSQLGGNGDLFYGSDKAGAVSVNGGRGRSNNFSVNGGDANDQFVNLPTVQPTPDAIDEFRVLTNTFDAEYGRNSGAVVNVVTKSGTNAFHGNLYEYFRNKALNARGFFDTTKPQFNQNQFGGTFGGPIKKDRTFFFVSYEGRRIRQGKSSDTVAVPSALERSGDFSTGSTFGGGFDPVNSIVGQVLDGRPGCDAALGLGAGGVQGLPVDPQTNLVDWSTVFPTNHIPSSCMDPVAVNLMNKYVPAANTANGFLQTVPTGSDRQDQVTFRFDHHITDKQTFSAYYYFTDEDLFQPFAFFQAAGANVPGFGSTIGQRYQQYNLSHTWTITNTLVNEARFTYNREAQRTFQHPQVTNLVTNSCDSSVSQFCFTGTSDSSAINALSASGQGNPKFGITPNLGQNHEGVPFITVSGGFVIGNNFEGELPQVGNSFQWSDNMTWVRGDHTMKFGADVRRQRFDQTLFFDVNGSMTVDSSTSNAVVFDDNYPGYLLGLADSFGQGSAQVENVRSTAVYLFAQDSWKIKPNLTLNYGLRWELNTPLVDVSQHVQTFRPGQNSTIFPCALSAESQASLGVNSPDCNAAGVTPTGLVVPGDKGVQPGMTQTYYNAFAPRIGIAYSPDHGKTSIHAGWGLFYNPMEQLVLEQFSAEPPFGGSSFFSGTFFNTPFVSQGGFANPNPFNGILNPPRGQPVDWSTFRPILLFGEFQPHMRTQYSAQYNFNVQRELTRDMVLQIGYVGSQGHRLLAAHDLNPGNPQTCLDLQAISVAASDSALSCGPFFADSAFSIAPGEIPQGMTLHMPYGSQATVTGPNPTAINLVGLRPFSSPNCNPLSGTGCPVDGIPVFSNIFALDTIANSSYNSLQASLEKRFSHGLQFQAAYTFSKSLDWTSSFEETLNPFNFASNNSLSLFDSRHRFVLSYYWDLPIPKQSGFMNKLVNDWSVSGITTFQSGFPIRLQTQDDSELISSLFFAGTAAPQLNGSLHVLDPRKNPNNLYFDPTNFSDPPLGQFATTKRTICCGPGTNNWDFAVHKKVAVDESRYFQFRAEIFNLFNHTQFFNPDGNFSDGAVTDITQPQLGADFGRVKRARDPRLVQLALKFFF